MDKKSSNREEVYKSLCAFDWELYIDYPAAKRTIMRKNTSSILDYYSWAYCTIMPDGRVLDGSCVLE